MGPGSNVITVTETNSTYPVSAQDYWFGLLTYEMFSNYPNNGAVAAKFNPNGVTAACSPFNGPGGTPNPYFTMTLNGAQIPARFQGVGAQCNNACTSTLTLDPDAYAVPGPYYNSNGLVGPTPNPYVFDPTAISATADHAYQYASSVDASGNAIWGEFMSPVMHRGTITGYSWVQCGVGQGC
jgi:hypothetical protein